MTDSDRSRYVALCEELKQHNERYYAQDAPIIADAEYDALMRELQSLEQQYPEWASADSPSQTVGAEPQARFTQIAHEQPMLSLSNGFSADEGHSLYSVLELLSRASYWSTDSQPFMD